MVPDRIERKLLLRHSPARVWEALTTAEGLAGWFGSHARIDLRPGGRAWVRWADLNIETEVTITVVEPPHRFGFRWDIDGLPPGDPRQTEVVFTLTPKGESTRLRVVETGFSQVAEELAGKAHQNNSEGWDAELADLVAYLDGSRR